MNPRSRAANQGLTAELFDPQLMLHHKPSSMNNLALSHLGEKIHTNEPVLQLSSSPPEMVRRFWIVFLYLSKIII